MRPKDARLARLLDAKKYEEKLRFENGWLPPSWVRQRFPYRLAAKGLKETECALDLETGEPRCAHAVMPQKQDCRQPFCRWRSQMRDRVETRLRRHRLALEKRLHGAR